MYCITGTRHLRPARGLAVEDRSGTGASNDARSASTARTNQCGPARGRATQRSATTPRPYCCYRTTTAAMRTRLYLSTPPQRQLKQVLWILPQADDQSAVLVD